MSDEEIKEDLIQGFVTSMIMMAVAIGGFSWLIG